MKNERDANMALYAQALRAIGAPVPSRQPVEWQAPARNVRRADVRAVSSLRAIFRFGR